MDNYFNTVHDLKGNALAGASIAVYKMDGTPATIFTAQGAPIVGGLTTGLDGSFNFSAEDGKYEVRISVNGTLYKTLPPVTLFDGPNLTIIPKNPGFRRTAVSQVLSGRHRDLSNFPFMWIRGNGTVYTQADIKGGADISSIFGRIDDTASVTGLNAASTKILSQDLAAWQFRIQPSHLLTIGRPRSLIYGQYLEQRKHYRMHFIFRTGKLSNGMPWCDRNSTATVGGATSRISQFYGSIFSLEQASDDSSAIKFSTGQLNGSSSPLYFVLNGNTIYPEFRTIGEEMGLRPDDLGGGAYTQWAVADTDRTSLRTTAARMLTGSNYNEVVLDFFLDDRPQREGGQGYFSATFNRQFWFEHRGVTSHPPNAAGQHIPLRPRWGLYEASAATPGVNGALCETVPTCIFGRFLNARLISCEVFK